jgi:hypothetical protein
MNHDKPVSIQDYHENFYNEAAPYDSLTGYTEETERGKKMVEAAVAAALIKAADDIWYDQTPRQIKEAILALPRDDSALREICMRVAREAYDEREYVAVEEIVDRILKGETK